MLFALVVCLFALKAQLKHRLHKTSHTTEHLVGWENDRYILLVFICVSNRSLMNGDSAALSMEKPITWRCNVKFHLTS